MSGERLPFYISTPIYYVNDRPHIGHCFTTVVADVAARFERLRRGIPTPRQRGPDVPAGDVFFLTGTDEHADKVVTSAVANKMSPQAWADRNAAEFERAFAALGITNDDFLRTTQQRHKERVTGYIRKMLERGDVYRGEYTGWYDEGQEEYVAETAAKDAEYKSKVTGKPLARRTEACYFFKLSRYGELLQKHIESHPEFVEPEARRLEVLGRIKLGLNDVPITRPVTADPATQWGIRMPDDPAHRVYVWIDALFNYLTAVDMPARRQLWPDKILKPTVIQLIGKDILWFHAVIWPSLLMSIGEQLPTTVYAHGWWLSEGQKMSKSLGNFIDLETLNAYSSKYSVDALRWFMLTQGPLGANDANFAHAKFVESFNADLANGIGNCSSRVANMLLKYFGGKIPMSAVEIDESLGIPPFTLDFSHGPETTTKKRVAGSWAKPTDVINSLISSVHARLDHFDLQGALRLGTDLVRAVDRYINITAPFQLAKFAEIDPVKRSQLAAILTHCAEAVRVAALILSPAMPNKMAQLLADWSSTPPVTLPFAEVARLDGPCSLLKGTRVYRRDALFMRVDPAESPPARVAG